MLHADEVLDGGRFHNFSCEAQRAFAFRLAKRGIPAVERFDAWFDAARKCALRV